MLCKQSFILLESQLYLYYSLLILVSVLLYSQIHSGYFKWKGIYSRVLISWLREFPSVYWTKIVLQRQKWDSKRNAQTHHGSVPKEIKKSYACLLLFYTYWPEYHLELRQENLKPPWPWLSNLCSPCLQSCHYHRSLISEPLSGI